MSCDWYEAKTEGMVDRMDRRQKKTRDAIFAAFTSLLQNKRYEHITVQHIIEEADIGRSTFYAHFETKDELLKAMCTQIFEHIFSAELIGEETHDFSNQTPNLKEKLIHLLYHLKDKHAVICSILSSDSKDVFMRYFKEYLVTLFGEYICKDSEIPYEYRQNHLISDFAELVDWWVKKQMNESPETMISYYFATNVI